MTFVHSFILPPEKNTPTGGNIYNRELIASLKRRGWEAEIRSLNSRRPPLTRSKRRIYWIDSLCLAQGIEEVQLEDPSAWAFLIVHLLHSFESYPGFRPNRKLLNQENTWLPHYQGFLVTSPLTKQRLQKKFRDRRPIFLVPPALCLTPKIRDPKNPESEPEFKGVMAGHFTRRKGFLPFLKLLRKRLDRNDSFTLKIAGRTDMEPEYTRSCRRIIQSSVPLSRSVHITGALPPEKMRRLYRESNIFISSSFGETFGMAIAEAHAFGLPVFALNRGYISRHVQPRLTGCLYNEMDSLADACLELIQSPGKLRHILCCMPPAKRNPYSWNHAARSLINQFEHWKKKNPLHPPDDFM